MRSKLTTLLAVIGAATVLVLAANTVAMATTGSSFLLGKSNSANNVTALTRTTDGPALKVTTKSSKSAPLVVNGTGKVTHLNADTVDGKDSSVLGTRALVWSYAGSTTTSTTRTWKTSNLPAGSYLVNYEVFLSPGAGNIDCYLRRNTENLYAAEGGAPQTQLGTSVTNAGVITFVNPGFVTLTCLAANSNVWNATQLQPVRITAVPVNLTLKGSPTVSKQAAK